jgi:hypothetical protein
MERIRGASSKEDVARLERSLDRLWEAGVFSPDDIVLLDNALCDRLDELQGER